MPETGGYCETKLGLRVNNPIVRCPTGDTGWCRKFPLALFAVDVTCSPLFEGWCCTENGVAVYGNTNDDIGLRNTGHTGNARLGAVEFRFIHAIEYYQDLKACWKKVASFFGRRVISNWELMHTRRHTNSITIT